MFKTLAFLLLMSVYSHSRSIRDLNVPFNGNVFDYLDEDFASDTVSSTTTTTVRTVTTKKRIVGEDTSASSTSASTSAGLDVSTAEDTSTSSTSASTSTGLEVSTSTPSTPMSSPSTTTAAPENAIVRVFHSSIPIDMERKGFQPTSVTSSELGAALNELKFMSRKQSDQILKLRTEVIAKLQQEVAKIDERWTNEISALREDVNGLVKALPPFDKHVRFDVSNITSSEPKHDVNVNTSSSYDDITASESKNR